jgi:uncharacterized protein YdeI (BOF family)
MRRLIALACLLMLGGCATGRPVVLGQAPTGAVETVAALRHEPTGQLRMVSGVMVEKCPVAGCWFDLRDTTGTLRVSTKDAGFAVLDVPLGAKVRVAGRIRQTGSEASLDATGLQY